MAALYQLYRYRSIAGIERPLDIEAALPQPALPAKPVLRDLQSFRCKLVRSYPAGLVRAHQAALLEHFEVLDERWQGHVV